MEHKVPRSWGSAIGWGFLWSLILSAVITFIAVSNGAEDYVVASGPVGIGQWVVMAFIMKAVPRSETKPERELREMKAARDQQK